ncbi:MAG: DUF2617 family protein, partial [Anaerolineaceae bacterium]|nr:DUF2617 family protein [Anaerolineaceae bacterium]
MFDLLEAKPSDMELQLYLRPIHPEFFKIFAWRSFEGPGYEAELWITGLSHVLTVRSMSPGGRPAERCVTEVIGPADLPLPKRGRVESLDLKGEDEATFALRNGFRYHLTYHIERLAEDVFAATYEDLRKQGRSAEGVACEYRLEGRERAMWPLAFVMPTHIRGGFLLHAFHCFPDQATILKTQTLIELPKR